MTLRPADRTLLALAAVAIAIAAADTYVVVLALPDMSAAAGLDALELQRSAPIISGFLLGYVAMLPLIGRVADLEGRVPVLLLALAVFAAGSAVTMLAYDLPGMVVGRFLQGVGGGGLVPATMALVADLYPKERRGLPLGLVSAVQEFGSVLGPVAGALVLAVATWRGIFALNLAAAAVLLVAVGRAARRSDVVDAAATARRAAGRDVVSWLLLLVLSVAGALNALRPPGIVRDLFWGQFFVSYVGTHRWLTPVGLVAVLALVALVVWSLATAHPLLDLRRWWRAFSAADLPGALLLAAALGGIVLAFGTGDPAIQVFSPAGPWYLLGSAVAAVLFVVHLRRAADPVVPRGALAHRNAWGGLLVSFFVGSALIAAVVSIPIFAALTVHRDSQVAASLVLVRLLVALPVGAVLGGWLLRRLPAGVIAGGGMLLAAAGFVWMASWDAESLEHVVSTVPLLVTGLGFGLALAPVNAAVLAATDDDVHGLASAMTVVARMVGMLVGISALTALGLRAFYAAQRDIPAPAEVCGDEGSRCSAYIRLQLDAALTQEQFIFAGAAVCALVAAVLALVLLRGSDTREVGNRGLLIG
ncbi:MFS family permease [Nocardioides zeae]|uniref:MFS family permease n=2 Tax=Nocardioides zeae TaxID=1457234 RepID=A0AAJ1X2A8_9ACTN|nr:MFS transporter [Nocardioides zeae]MDQ1104349.1 MFS family permease [Nocardioides zeae]MDR6175961.1 MFS family permease [Nocardioides zeae]MDR6211742.1 MFS family permease [Nocardioides zeae]